MQFSSPCSNNSQHPRLMGESSLHPVCSGCLAQKDQMMAGGRAEAAGTQRGRAEPSFGASGCGHVLWLGQNLALGPQEIPASASRTGSSNLGLESSCGGVHVITWPHMLP